jgi:hypothetical protein
MMATAAGERESELDGGEEEEEEEEEKKRNVNEVDWLDRSSDGEKSMGRQ